MDGKTKAYDENPAKGRETCRPDEGTRNVGANEDIENDGTKTTGAHETRQSEKETLPAFGQAVGKTDGNVRPGSRIAREKRTVERMIRLYCRKGEGNAALCPECRRLLEYARARLDCCPFGERKTSCRRCPVHCYRPRMRERMRRVMRYAGPRMLWYHPLDALRHLFG